MRRHILNIAITEFAAKGFSGARIDAIAKSAQTNIRMLYHYFGSIGYLYVAVLETVIAELRQEELKLDFSNVEPLAGLMQLFDVIDRHFSEHQELISILWKDWPGTVMRSPPLTRRARSPVIRERS